jgi:hypothetical protein
MKSHPLSLLVQGDIPNIALLITAFRTTITSLPFGHAEIAPYFVNYLGSHSSMHPQPPIMTQNQLPFFMREVVGYRRRSGMKILFFQFYAYSNMHSSYRKRYLTWPCTTTNKTHSTASASAYTPLSLENWAKPYARARSWHGYQSLWCNGTYWRMWQLW